MIKGFKSYDQFLNEMVLTPQQQFVVSYGGKFSPFHPGHFEIYEKLCKKFGKNNVYITTAGIPAKPDPLKHFLNFSEKRAFMTRIFNIPQNHIFEVKSNYSPIELLQKFPENTAFITVLGKKDAERLVNYKYFKWYSDDEPMDGYKEHGYVYIEENDKINLSATEIRDFFRNPENWETLKKQYFKSLYKKFDQTLFNLLNDRLVENELLREGGSFGHLSHVYEDLDLTFGDLKEIIDAGLRGELDELVEKSDGMALSLSYKNGKIVYSRNKGQYKNFGENALDGDDIKNMFIGRGTIYDAYSLAIDDLENSILKLPKKELDEIFNNGQNFMHLEVMYSQNEVTVPYGLELLVFHNVSTYDENGNLLKQDRKASDKLAKMIKDINADIQKTFKIQGSPYIDMKAINDLDKKKSDILKKIKNLQNGVKMSDDNTFADYYTAKLTEKLEQTNPNLTGFEISNLSQRWIYNNKSIRIDKNNIELGNIDWAKEFEKNELPKIYSNIRRPLELICIELGLEIISNMKTFLAANPDEATKQLKKELDDTIAEIKNSGDTSALEKMERRLERLELSGGIEKIFPTEGIIFTRTDKQGNQKLYKLTGTFADVHKILGILKFGN